MNAVQRVFFLERTGFIGIVIEVNVRSTLEGDGSRGGGDVDVPKPSIARKLYLKGSVCIVITEGAVFVSPIPVTSLAFLCSITTFSGLLLRSNVDNGAAT